MPELQTGKYYQVDKLKLQSYMKTLWPQTSKIIKDMLRRTGDNTLYVCGPDLNGYVEVASNQLDGIIGGMKIPSNCLINNQEFQMEQFVESIHNKLLQESKNNNDNRTILTKENIDKKIVEFYSALKDLDEEENLPEIEAKANETSEFSVENDLKMEAYDGFISALEDFETSTSNLYLAFLKAKDFNINNLGKEGYPFDFSIDELRHKIIKYVATQKIAQFKVTGEEPK